MTWLDRCRAKWPSIAAELRKGLSPKAVAKLCRVSISTVYSVAGRSRRPLNGRAKPPAVNSFRALKLLLDGFGNQAEIAEALGLTRQQVQEVATRAREAGFEFHTAKPGGQRKKGDRR